jgi:DNA-binding transcriptional LysR family regulator
MAISPGLSVHPALAVGPAGAAGLRERAAKVHNLPMFDWNDLRHFLAVARHGSTLAAGRALGLSQSTVQRRLIELERRLGRQLVQRHPTGYQLTEFGREMLPYAERIGEAVQGFEQHLADSRRDVVGVVRVTCPEPLMFLLQKSPLLDRFHALHPGLRVEFVMSDRYVDLAKGEADIALRSGDTDDAQLVGRKIADSIWAVYASKAYVERHGKPERVEDISRHAVIGLDESMANHRAAKWLAQVAPDAKIVARNNSVLGVVYAVKSGIGLAPLPTAVGDAEEALVRVLGPIPELARSWRLLTLPELRKAPRVASFFDFIIDEIDSVRKIVTG